VAGRGLSEPRDELFLQRCSNRWKINSRTDCRAITGSQRHCEPPERKVRRYAIEQENKNAKERKPADQFH